jgi:nucleotide-binding universal stress UspA family protein
MIEIRRILCPIDYSDASRHALQHAAALARWYDATLVALHAVNPVYFPPAMVTSPELARATLAADFGPRELEEQLRSWLADLGPGLKGTDALVVQGDPIATIIARAQSLPADLIVLGTHGHGGFDHLVLGSITEKVLRKASCPVMTVPPPAVSPRPLPYQRLLCAVDFSKPAAVALRYALSIAKESNARLMILHVVEWPDLERVDTSRAPNLAAFERFQEEEARRQLEALVSADDRTWCEVVTRLDHGRAWQRILATAEEGAVDLIVMGVHGRSAIDLTLFGSTTNHVIRRAPCPVLTLKH